MKTVACIANLPLEDGRALVDLELPLPEPGPRDLRVRLSAMAVNPVDLKVRRGRAASPESPVILGWDGSGVVEAVGAEVTLFSPGEEVFFAGSLQRPGTYAEATLVDERIAGHKPANLSFPEAAALPLTALTAWEALFDRMKVPFGQTPTGETLLVTAAAGGVGSMAVQLARRLTGLTVIGTASRLESAQWVSESGAHGVADHSLSLTAELERLGHPQIPYILSLKETARHWDALCQLLAPQGHLCLIDDPGPLELGRLKAKAGTLHWEYMFTRSLYETPDMIRQHWILEEVSALAASGVIRSTLSRNLGPLSAATVQQAHALLASGSSIGKLVLERP